MTHASNRETLSFIYIDFTERLPYSNFYLVIMMVMDMLSKYGNFMVIMVHPYTTFHVSFFKRRIIKEVLRLTLFYQEGKPKPKPVELLDRREKIIR